MADAAPTALVTGAASGIGRAIALRLGALGYRLALVDIDGDALGRFAQQTPSAGTTTPFAADVADADAWANLRDTLLDRGDDVALFVQAAGALVVGRLTECSPAQIERLVAVNLTGPLLGAAAIGPLLARSAAAKGTRPPPLPRGMLTVASIFGVVSPPGFAVYNATKGGVISLTETLRGEWAPQGLTTTAVLPGVTRTGLFDRAAYASEAFRALVAGRVAGTELTAERVAQEAIDAYRRRKALFAIGPRARRFHALKRLAPRWLLRRVADETNRELPPPGQA